MNLLWLLLIPAGLFLGCSIGVGFFKAAEYHNWDREWWFFPLWMVTGVCVIVPIIVAGFSFGLGLALGFASF